MSKPVDSQPPGPLAGLRVIELAGIGPAPYACLLLAELGADVLRIDRVTGAGGGPLRVTGLHRTRPSVAVDLKTSDGRDLVLGLVEEADVLIEANRPGVAERLGLGPEECQGRNARLIYGRMTGWGQEGPLAHTAGHDITYAAIAGALHTTGTREKPLQAVNLVADFGGGAMFLLLGVLAALHERNQSGLGQVVDAAMVDGAASLTTMLHGMLGAGAWRDERRANLLDGGAPFYDTYECSDGKHVAVGAIEPQFYAQLLSGLGVADLLEGEQHEESCWPQHREVFTRAFATRTRDEWAALFSDTDACVAPVLSLSEAPHHPHMAWRGVFADVDGSPKPKVAPRFSRTPGLAPASERVGGQDSRAGLAAWGVAEDEIERLEAAGVIQQHESSAAEGDVR